MAAGCLILSALLAALLQRHWQSLDWYVLARRGVSARSACAFWIAETWVILAWAGLRGAALGRRARASGQLSEYLTTALGPMRIVLMLTRSAAGAPVVLSLFSLLISWGITAVSPEFREFGFKELANVHMLMVSGSVGFAAVGLAASRGQWLAEVTPTAVLLAACGAVLTLNPVLGRWGEATTWLWWALLPNPITAAGAALGDDVLRFTWIYPLTRAPEFFYVYPQPEQTALSYGALAVASSLLSWTSLRRSPETATD